MWPSISKGNTIMDKAKVLFLCVENSCRSQIAEAFAKKYGSDIVEAYSAGSKPSGKINPMAVEVMKEAGVDISNNVSKGFKDLPFKQVDYIVGMGCGDACPIVPAAEFIEWSIPDPKNQPIEFFRKVRDEIEKNVKELIGKIKDHNEQR